MSEKKEPWIWSLDYRKIVLGYIIVCVTSIILDIILTGSIWLSFWISYAGLFFSAHYINEAIVRLFKQFHITSKYRNLITPWILFGIVFFYITLLVNSGIFPFDAQTFFTFSILWVIILIIISISSFIRIVAVGFHRRKIVIFPINRIEYAAMAILEKERDNRLKFTDLKTQIKGILNIFIDTIYFDDETAASSIYHLCGLRLADINDDIVELNAKGKEEVKSWKKILDLQQEKYNNIINSKSILIKSFLGLFSLSVLKIIIGTTSSDSLMAEGFENFLDCIAIVLIGMGIKFRKEKLINIVLICLMAFTGASILFDSLGGLLNPEPILNSTIIITIALISIFLNVYLKALKNFIGKKNKNSSLVASAVDSQVNIALSIGIICGALFSDFGTYSNLTFLYYLDSIIALIVCILIFKEVYEIFSEFIVNNEKIEYKAFQMKYEKSFKEYIIKWILMVYNDNIDKRFSSEDLNKIFQNSVQKGEDIYGKFSHFGLYSYKENGLMQVIKYLLKKEFLTILEDRSISITEKGEFIYKYFYSGQLLEDIKDPFDFFFEHRHDTLNLLNKKKEIIQKFNNLHK